MEENLPNNQYVGVTTVSKSYFDGGLLELVLTRLVGIIITVFTLGICAPWATVIVERYMAKHTVINGRRLRFDGTALGLFGNWIKWLLLTIITLGIYGFWVHLAMKKWVTKHTHFDN